MNEWIQRPLISERLFKMHSPVTANTDITEFIPYIAIAQELHLVDVLGKPLIEELQQQIADNNLTEENSELILQIAPCLSFYAVYQALPFHWASVVNKGITIRESENSRGVDIKDLAQLRQWLKNDADVLNSRLLVFLAENKTSYPLWRPRHWSCQSASTDEKGIYNSGFYFSAKR